MRIDILTLFPEMFAPLNESILKRAQDKGVLQINTVYIRDYSLDKHLKCDDAPFGGGAGMVMTPQPICDCINSVDPERKAHRIYMSPRGKLLTVPRAREYAQKYDWLLILCGHYEGIDQRIIDLCIDEEMSIGDFVLTGGELPAMVLCDVVSRFVPGVLGCDASSEDESFSDGLLEYPQYTRPQTYEGLSVPEVLLSGHHENIEKWRREQSLKITKQNRPDLLEKK
ncbi:MAG: tRNA (guanosine(37)-N1)-methyltransferase TrmD [Firmicutes bacterium]|nr:tRNA (guanosine(37)-N1)-methyltransferase TrmD [Bacillota bacterium]MDY5531481.1 tRNA (guanosine(37)-N1)-methyltransferase TrmD [Pumilibacteraceae bacterium]